MATIVTENDSSFILIGITSLLILFPLLAFNQRIDIVKKNPTIK